MSTLSDILAARVHADTTLLDQVITFFSFEHLSIVYGLIGAALLGICCGLLGCFIVLRKMALLGDSIGHAVLPGICLAFVITQTKNALAIFIGAIVAGVIATWAISVISRYSRIKSDTAVGLVLSSFFGLGIVLLTRIQRMSYGDQSGLDRYMFGDAAAMGRSDLQLMAGVTVVVVLSIVLFFRQFKLTSFDENFAASIGMPVRVVQFGLMTLLALAIVVSLQAVGVVLVSAMLITPAATAYLLTHRLQWMLLAAAGLGVVSGVTGVFLSFVLDRIPTGPCMVLAASFWFSLAYLFAPSQGIVLRAWRSAHRRRRVQRENLLKTIHALGPEMEGRGRISLGAIAHERGENLVHIRRLAGSLAAKGMADLDEDGIELTPAGQRRAEQIVRNHRLWELYLTREADIAADHVHRDAEEIEHVLAEEIVARLEEMLDHPERDPHGSRIPRVERSSNAGTDRPTGVAHAS